MWTSATTAQWLTVFADAVPAAPVLALGEALDRAASASDRVESVEAGPPGVLRLLSSPIRTARPVTDSALAPALGADTSGPLSELGISPDQQAELRKAGVT
jgi:succinate--hydroxymethylglutarate CoA-transferase